MTTVTRYLWGQRGGIPNPVTMFVGAGSTAGTNTSTVSFPTQVNSTYYLSITLTSGSGTISAITKHVSNFVITWTGSVTNTYDWILIR